jgi:hypothetical protein
VQMTRYDHTGWLLGDRMIEMSDETVCGLYCA